MLILLLKELRYRWIIHLLIILLMACVISILVIQSSVNSSAEEKINDLSHKLGRGMLVVPEETDLEQFYRMKYGQAVMPDDYGDRIKASPLGKHARMIQPRLYGNITVQGTDVILVGQQMRTPGGIPPGVDFMAVASGAARELGISAGEKLDIRGTTLQAFRVLDPPPKGLDMALIVPLDVAQRILGQEGKINALHMGGCWCEMDVPAFAASVETTLPGTMAVTVEGMAKAQTEINQTMEKYSVAIWIAGAILAAGSIMFLIFYILYKGSREIGLLLSIGLSPGRIIVKNIVISVLTALAGALSGYLLSVPVMKYFGKIFMKIGLSPAWDHLPYFLATALAVALVAGSFPSWYVTRLDPTKLLREE